MIVLDTHVWLCWLHDPVRLSPAAARLIEKEQETGALVLSVISVWEVAVKIRSKQPIATVYSPSHQFDIQRGGATEVAIKIPADRMQEPGPRRAATGRSGRGS